LATISLVRGYVHEVIIACGAEVIARHPRSYERDDRNLFRDLPRSAAIIFAVQ
jgi:hypothetical protein